MKNKRNVIISLITIFVVASLFVLTACQAPEIKEVGKAFSQYKQVSGNLYYDANNDNVAYCVNYNAIGEKSVEIFKKDGYICIYDTRQNQLVKTSVESVDNLKYYLQSTSNSIISSTVAEITITSKTVQPTNSTKVRTTATTKKISKRTTKTRSTTRYYTTTTRKKTTTRYYTTTRKKTTTKKPTTTKQKIFEFDGHKYYIDENGKWILIS